MNPRFGRDLLLITLISYLIACSGSSSSTRSVGGSPAATAHIAVWAIGENQPR